MPKEKDSEILKGMHVGWPIDIRQEGIKLLINSKHPFTFRVPYFGIEKVTTLDDLDLTQQEMEKYGLEKDEEGKIHKKVLRGKKKNRS